MPISDIELLKHEIQSFSVRTLDEEFSDSGELSLSIEIDESGKIDNIVHLEIDATFNANKRGCEISIAVKCSLQASEDVDKRKLHQRLAAIHLVGICRGVIAQNTALMPTGPCWLPPLNLVSTLKEVQEKGQHEEKFAMKN